MYEKLRHRATPLWAALFLIFAISIAVVARLELVHKTKPGPANANVSLRIGAGTAPTHRSGTLEAGATATAISAGDYSSCAVVAGGVDCWGAGGHGQLGTGVRESSLIPMPVKGLSRKAVSVTVGGSHACAVLVGGSVACWGAGAHGEIGNGTRLDALAPVLVPRVHHAVAAAAGVAHTCALLKNGAIDCWGANTNGQLGDGTNTDSAWPTRVRGVAGATAVAAGLAHTCALLVSGAVTCWGANANGELGDGNLLDSWEPVAVSGLRNVTAIAAGDAHTCAVLQDGAVRCWGWNIEGQLGNAGNDSPTPIAVAGLRHRITAISAGGNDTCALARGSGVVCWGANLDGQLGNGDTADSASPVVVGGLGSNVTAVSAGFTHACALLAGGSTTCWGANAHGELGDGTTSASSTPVAVTGLGLSPDGSGTISVAPPTLASGTKKATVTFTYTAAPGGTLQGALAVEVPDGWSLPTASPNAPGWTTTTSGHLSIVGRTIHVSGLTLAAGDTATVVYGHGAGARPAKRGGVWRVEEQSSPDGALVLLKAQPAVSLLAADGSGRLATKSALVPRNGKLQALRFVYTAAGALHHGTLELTVPDGWSLPTMLSTAPGFTTASTGTLSVRGKTITVADLRLSGEGTLTIVYRGKAPAADVGAQTWDASERSGPTGTLRQVPSAPAVTVLSPDGSGKMTANPTTVPNGAKRVTLTFSYTAGKGGVKGGVLSLIVPAGWSAPTTKPKSPGFVSSPSAKVTVSGRSITVPVQQLAGNAALSISYAGATAPKGLVGGQNWVTFEQSTRAGKPKPIPQAAQVTVLAPDGSGTLTRASGPVTAGSSGNTVVWTYKAALGGMSNGTLELTVPAGWSAPSTRPKDPGYVTASPGTVSVKGQAITVSGLTLPSGGTVTITYGSRAGAGPGAAAPPGSIGPPVWVLRERSTG